MKTETKELNLNVLEQVNGGFVFPIAFAANIIYDCVTED